MKYNFDKIYDRRGTDSIKHDNLAGVFGRDDLTSLWIADMDFKSPDCVAEALKARLDHQVYGYSFAPDSYWDSIIKWKKELNGWEFTREELTFVPGIVRGLSYVINCLTKPGDRIIVQPPVYTPFYNLIKNNRRELVFNPLVYNHGIYDMDLNDLENKIDFERPKLMILCNPHNPSGRVWSRETLARVAEICSRYGVIVASDEIHGDMPLFDNVFTPFALASETARDISICFGAPSKTFNIPGLMSSFAVVHNPAIRKTFFDYLNANEFNSPPFTAVVATEAAFTKGHDWRRQMLDYVGNNVNFVYDFIGVNIPQIYPVKPQASFLMWLNCNKLGLSHDELIDLFVNRARLALNDGETFGPGGEGFMRLNVGCPLPVLKKALEQLKAAVEQLKNE